MKKGHLSLQILPIFLYSVDFAFDITFISYLIFAVCSIDFVRTRYTKKTLLHLNSLSLLYSWPHQSQPMHFKERVEVMFLGTQWQNE